MTCREIRTKDEVCMDEDKNSTGLIVRELETEAGVVEVGQRSDGYINVTNLCQAKGKLFGNWRQLDGSQEYLEALSLDIGIPVPKLLVTIQGRGDSWDRIESINIC